MAFMGFQGFDGFKAFKAFKGVLRDTSAATWAKWFRGESECVKQLSR
jgi:hypothetical protein